MLDAALRLGGALRSRSILPGAAIAFQLPNWWEACVINLSAALFGYRLVPLLTIYRQSELGFILPACDVSAIFVPESWRGFDYPALVASVPGAPRHVFTLRGDATAQNSFETLLAQKSDAFREVVLVEFPRTDCWSIGFVTGASKVVWATIAAGPAATP